ncbi:putative membrane protein [Sulfuriferula multivorans]|uniref:Putative membrane protein n=1 Tax=Sulfuriferula multivorans TaxID=1559896 RepID=A0A401JI32_9PROT|nr:hypothetical protein [Sulfuriferula multivorans]GBL47706.1 putative membrane protein [Sulfuriferula multivorans]
MILPAATLGMLGGVIAFGLIGLFIAPLILAVTLSVWRECLEDSCVETKTTWK